MIEEKDIQLYKPYIESLYDAVSFIKSSDDYGSDEDITLLDAGCGHSETLEEFYSEVSRVIGVDVDKNALGKNRLIDEKVLADLDKIPIKDDFVDIYTSAWVLEHIEKPDKVLAEAARIVKNGGYFVFITPNEYSFYSILAKIIPNSLHNLVTETLYGRETGDTYPTFYKLNSKKELDKYMEKHGFERVRFIYNDDMQYIGFTKVLKPLATLWDYFIMLPVMKRFRVHLIGIYKKV